MEDSQTCLPEDMLVAIFSRLVDVESLIRIMCVCKSWYRIVGSSSFIKAKISSKENKSYTFYTHDYSLVRREGLSNNKKYYYTGEQFGINVRKHNAGLKVYGSCKGLLCVSDIKLRVDSIIYLLNPITRRAKSIPNIPIEVYEPQGRSDLCLGYYDGDYKVIKIVGACSNYCVGVYSLSTNGWKILSCDSNDVSFGKLYCYPSSKCVNGVAYFVKYEAGIVCFDLHDERIREVKFPEMFNPIWWPIRYSFTMEACRESIALMEISDDGNLVKWVLRSVAKSTSWEKEFTIGLETAAHNVKPIGFTYNGEYILKYARNVNHYFTKNGTRRAIGPSDRFYLCDLGKSQLEECTMPRDLQAIDYFAGNLVLLNEQTLDPFVDPEATFSTKTTFVLCKRLPPKKKEKKDVLHKRQNELQGRTKRKLEEMEMKI